MFHKTKGKSADTAISKQENIIIISIVNDMSFADPTKMN